MAFLLILLACSLVIADAVQLDPYMSSFGKFDLKTNKEKRDLEFCRENCRCPGFDYLANRKRNDDTAPFREGSAYGPWQRDDFNYPSAAVRGDLFH